MLEMPTDYDYIQKSQYGFTYFNIKYDPFGDIELILKNEHQFQKESGMVLVESQEYFDINRLDDLERYIYQSRLRDQQDQYLFQFFIDFVKQIMIIEADKRMTIDQAL